MSSFDDTAAHDQVQLFFELLELIFTSDTPENIYLDERLKQLSYSNQSKVATFFKNIIDQPAFMTRDHKRIRQALMDWYSTHSTMVERVKNANDPYSLTSDALNELIVSFGFPYPHRIITNENKALFLLELVNLYNKKGTPITLVRSLQFFGLTNIKLSEWWIEKSTSGLFIARSQPVLPLTSRETDPREEIPYNEFIASDPFWHLDEDQLTESYNNSEITLPSLTPHFSLDAAVSTAGLYSATVIITKKMQESYNYWLAHGSLDQDIYLSRYGIYVSFLELTVSICYKFDALVPSNNPSFLQYTNPIDVNENDKYEESGDKLYASIIEEWDTIHRRPITRDERLSLLEEHKTKFSQPSENFFLQEPRDPLDPNDIGDSGRLLELMNETLKDLIDADSDTSLESLLLSLDGYLNETTGITTFSFAFFIAGSDMYDRMKDIIDFFKPYRSRIREFLTSMLINDPLSDSQLEDDYIITTPNLIVPDYITWTYDDPPIDGLYAQYPNMGISTQTNYPWIPTDWPYMMWLGDWENEGKYAYYGYRPHNNALDDRWGFNSIFNALYSDNLVEEWLFSQITQTFQDEDIIDVYDVFPINFPLLFVEAGPFGPTHGMDWGQSRDQLITIPTNLLTSIWTPSTDCTTTEVVNTSICTPFSSEQYHPSQIFGDPHLIVTEYFDNTNWENQINLSWNGTQWVTDPGVISGELTDIGTWVNDFRPALIKLYYTGTGGSTIQDITILDEYLNVLANETAYISGDEIFLDWTVSGTGNIHEIQIQKPSFGLIYITNIEFMILNSMLRDYQIEDNFYWDHLSQKLFTEREERDCLINHAVELVMVDSGAWYDASMCIDEFNFEYFNSKFEDTKEYGDEYCHIAVIGSLPLPGTGAWDSQHDNMSWTPEGSCLTWNVDKWVLNSGYSECALIDVFTWVVGFTPSQMRITYSGTNLNSVILFDASGDAIGASVGSYDSGDIVELEFAFIGDIHKLYITKPLIHTCEITDIEFLT